MRASQAVQFLDRGELLSETRSGGDRGRVFVSAPTVHLENASIRARTVGAGNAGNVDVQGAQVTLTGGAQMISSSGTVRAQRQVVVGTGRAGNVTITAQTLTLTDGRLTTETLGAGASGDLTASRASRRAPLSARSLASPRAGVARHRPGALRHTSARHTTPRPRWEGRLDTPHSQSPVGMSGERCPWSRSQGAVVAGKSRKNRAVQPLPQPGCRHPDSGSKPDVTLWRHPAPQHRGVWQTYHGPCGLGPFCARDNVGVTVASCPHYPSRLGLLEGYDRLREYPAP